MAIKKSFNNKSILKPGAYSKFKVDNSSGSPLRAADVLFLIGESDAGAPGSVEGIQEFEASRLDSLIQKYGSGPLVDSALAAVRPSKTPGVGGASKLIVYKTNPSVQAAVDVEISGNDLFKVKDVIYGLRGNNFSLVIAIGTTANQRLFSVNELAGTTENLGENAAQDVISIDYTGDASAATMTIGGAQRSNMTLSTSLTGQTDGSVNLSIILKNYTMKQLVDLINSQIGYAASMLTTSLSSKNANDLDPQAAASILTPVTVRRLQQEMLDIINASGRVQATFGTAPVVGLPVAGTYNLVGGAKGASTNAMFSTGFSTSLAKEYNVALPCVSRDASEDIADGDTDASSTYTISAVISAMESHLRLRGDTKNRKEAQGFAGIRKSSKTTAFASISGFASELIQVGMQDVLTIDSSGNLNWKNPHIFAAMCAGIRLGTPIGEPLTYKYINALGVGHFVNRVTGMASGDFNAGLDVDTAIESGVLFTEENKGGFRIVVDNTTYGADDSFVFNRGSVIAAAFSVFKTLRETADVVFVGKKVSNGLASSIKTVIRNKLRELNAPDVNIITSSDGAPEGFREDTFVVTVSGNTATVTVEFVPVQGLDFVLFSFTLGDIQQSA